MNSRGLDPLFGTRIWLSVAALVPSVLARLDFAHRFFAANEDLNILLNRVQDDAVVE